MPYWYILLAKSECLPEVLENKQCHPHISKCLLNQTDHKL